MMSREQAAQVQGVKGNMQTGMQNVMSNAVMEGAGSLPSNEDVAQNLEAMKIKNELPREKLSETGKELAEQMDRLADDSKRVFLDKNREEDMQKAALHASRAAQIARRHKLVSTKEGEEALEEARKGLLSGVNLARLIVLSPEFRDELADGLGIVVDSLRAKPRSQTHKSQRTTPLTPTSTPTGASSSLTSQQGSRDTGAMGQGGIGQGGVGQLERSDAGMDWTSEEEDEDEQGTSPLHQAKTGMQQGIQQMGGQQEQGSDTTTGGGIGASLKEGLGLGKDNYESLTQQQQDELAERFYRLMRKLQAKPEYQRAVSYLLEKLRSVQDKGGLHAERMETQLRETGPGRAFMGEASLARDHAIALVENWIEGSLDPLFHAFNSLTHTLQSDEESRRELSHLGHFVETCLRSPEVLQHEDNVKQEAKTRFNTVRERMMRQYSEPVQRLQEELLMLRDDIRDDEAAQVLQRDVKDLVNTILYDEQGQPTVKVELLRDLEYILSAFVKRVQFIPVPRVSATTPEYDFVADGIVLNLRELTPKQIHLETLTKVHDRELEAGKVPMETSSGTEPIELESFIRIHLTGITADLRDVHWYYNKKTGMIQEHDRGRADFKIHGKGLSIDLDVQPTLPVATQETPIAHTLEVLQCNARLHKMSLRVYDSKHDWAYAIFKPMIKSQIKKALQEAVESYMKEYIQRLDRESTVGMVGQYPATASVHVDKKDPHSMTTSSSGAQAQADKEEASPRESEAQAGVGFGEMAYLPL